jgi:hypothetical protein
VGLPTSTFLLPARGRRRQILYFAQFTSFFAPFTVRHIGIAQGCEGRLLTSEQFDFSTLELCFQLPKVYNLPMTNNKNVKQKPCPHPPARKFAWWAYNYKTGENDIFCVGCCEC